MRLKIGMAALCAAFACCAGVPVKWTVETSRADERVIDVYHGESLDMEVTFKSYGKILELPTDQVAATFWQTNGMNTAYWRTNNVEILSSNGIMRTTFGPDQDVGAKTLRGFIGIPGQIYRAAFVLRFKDAPGYDVDVVEWPYRLLDFEKIEVQNPPYYLKEEADKRIVELAPPEDLSGVVHGDDRASDQEQFENGIKFRAADSDGGTMRFRIQDPNDQGISWYSQSTDTTLGSPYMRINAAGIRHPSGRGDYPFVQSDWFDISRALSPLDYMPDWSDNRENYVYPITAGAFHDYFWNLTHLPQKAVDNIKKSITLKPATEMTDKNGNNLGVEQIQEGAAYLGATSEVKTVVGFGEWTSSMTFEKDGVVLNHMEHKDGKWHVYVDEERQFKNILLCTIEAEEDATDLEYTDQYGTVTLKREKYIESRNRFGFVTREEITNTTRKVSNSFWDEKNQVLWRLEFRDGEPMFVPITNENVKATGGVL